MKQVIKKHKSKNQYYLTKQGLWVRDYTKKVVAQDINSLTNSSDYDTILNNDLINASLNIANIDADKVYFPNIVIVSDGYKFNEKQDILSHFADDVVIIGTNRSLVKWNKKARMDYYLNNNPYKECMSCLPVHDYYPRCIVSSWVFPPFVEAYRRRRGVVYKYIPVMNKEFTSAFSSSNIYRVDDYRNPICAAIGLAYRWGVRKLLLFCCDDSFADSRAGAEQLSNKLWVYPQQHISHGLIDGNLYWLANQEFTDVQIANHSSGPEYDNVTYISEKELLDFFK